MLLQRFARWTAATSAGALAALFAVGCGGGEGPPSTPVAPGPSGVVQIRGSERLAWTQTAPSLDAVRAHTFLIYVDGTPSTVGDVRCSDGGAAGHSCSGRLPTMAAGRHVLELAAVWNGLEGPRSASLSVQVMALTASLTAPSAASRSAAHRMVACLGITDDCYDVDVLLNGTAALAFPVSTPDGRLLFVEDERLIRAVTDRVLPEPAFALDDPAARIVGLAIDSRFEDTRAVFVGWTVDGRDGARDLHITRLRELNNVLGQGATIVSGIAVPDAAAVPMAVDRQGLLYVAVPSNAHAAERATAGDYGGAVLRFTSDGRVPPDNRNGSPIVAIGFERPTALAVDASSSHVWLGGSRDGWSHRVVVISTRQARDAEWPARPAAVLPAAAEFFEPFLTFTGAALPATLRIIAAGDIHEVSFAADGGVRAVNRLQPSGIPGLAAMADGRDGERFAVARSELDRRSMLLHLTPR